MCNKGVDSGQGGFGGYCGFKGCGIMEKIIILEEEMEISFFRDLLKAVMNCAIFDVVF